MFHRLGSLHQLTSWPKSDNQVGEKKRMAHWSGNGCERCERCEHCERYSAVQGARLMKRFVPSAPVLIAVLALSSRIRPLS
jgi:hypothetical protein